MIEELSLRDRYPGLVPSNPQASEEIYIRTALLRPRFSQLFSMALDFGVNALKEQWAILKADPECCREVQRATPEVERILRNMEKGIALAAEKRKISEQGLVDPALRNIG